MELNKLFIGYNETENIEVPIYAKDITEAKILSAQYAYDKNLPCNLKVKES